MKRRLFLMLAACAVLTLSGALANFLLNPYGIWNTRLIDPIFRKPKDEHIALPYAIHRDGLSTLLVGTSRVVFGMRIDQLTANGIVNGGVRAASLRDSCAVVQSAFANPHLKRIVWGLDFFQFNQGWNPADPEFQRRFSGGPGVVIEDALLSLAALDNGIDDFKRMLRGRARLPITATAPIPWPPDTICRQFAAQRSQGLVAMSSEAIVRQIEILPGYQNYRWSDEFWRLFRATIDQAQRRRVQMILFVPPMSEYELEVIRRGGLWSDFDSWKRHLVTAGPVWDFSGYNRVARAGDFYSDVMHHKPPVGQTLLRDLLGMPLPSCDGIAQTLNAGRVRLEQSNIDNAIAEQDRAMMETASDQSRYSRLAAIGIKARQDRAAANLRASF
ncbi:MAG: hypothetical protein IVW54_14500 [Candidatus Binataceae bacterium]|nr:hypothetical protein [Candidatus Binataceae bacterium]